MPGKHITDQQVRLYMSFKQSGHTQTQSAAKAGISERSARRIDQGNYTSQSSKRTWRTREDPLESVWNSVLVPLLEANPVLSPITLFDFLCDHYPGQFDETIRRTLQRRVKDWKLVHGPEKEVMFRQTKQPGRLGLSDFTVLKGITITLEGKEFSHRLYHYRLSYSGWRYVKVVLGGESFAALSAGLQEALWRSGGVPEEHRTDSLSAAYKNQVEKEELTEQYTALCRHYGIRPTRNNPGLSHENGAIEAPHGHLKRRIEQALMFRGSNNFANLDAYQHFIDEIVAKLNRQCHSRFQEERPLLQPLPKRRTHEYLQQHVVVSSSCTIVIKRVVYTVPSRLIGQRLCVHIYDERLELYCGHQRVYKLKRQYANKYERKRCVNYRHVIGSLVRKPQAFRYSQLRDDLLPSEDYRLIWRHVDEQLDAQSACRYIVKLLHFAAEYDCEQALGRYVLSQLEHHTLPSEKDYRQRFMPQYLPHPNVHSEQHNLKDYDLLLETARESAHG